MQKTGIIYWPKGGNVERVARKIYDRFDKTLADIYDLQSIETTDLVNYDCLIFGGSTVGAEIWEEAEAANKWGTFFRTLDKINLKGKQVALFGLGDQVLYPNHFVDALAYAKEGFEKRGAKIIGKWPVEGYEFIDSQGMEKDYFLGLAIDEDSQPELTDKRIDQWLNLLKKEMNW